MQGQVRTNEMLVWQDSTAWHITWIRWIGMSGIWEADGFTRLSSVFFSSAIHIITRCHTRIHLQLITMSVCRLFSRPTLFPALSLFRFTPSVPPSTKTTTTFMQGCSRPIHNNCWSCVTKSKKTRSGLSKTSRVLSRRGGFSIDFTFWDLR